MSLMKHVAKRSKAFSQDLTASMAASHSTKVQGYCPHCGTETTWVARVINGFHRCLRCGRNPFDAPRRSDDAQ